MLKKIELILLILLFSSPVVNGRPLRDGFGLWGVNGKVVRGDSNDMWLFEFDSEVNGDKGKIERGQKVKMLRTSALEKMVSSDDEERVVKGYRIWGKVTQYKGRNYIYVIYFLSIIEVERIEEVKEEPNETKVKPLVNEPNDELSIPNNILEKLKTKVIIRTEQLEKGFKLKQDMILADRTGFIVEKEDGGFEFELDALGRNIDGISFSLLPCQILERAELKQGESLEKIRFKVAGTLTKYKDKNYLILQRARRIYSHGNFPG